MPFAVVADVEVDFGPVPVDQRDRVAAWLVRAEARIRQLIYPATLEAQIATQATSQALVVQVEAEMVAAVLRNPDGWRTTTDTVGPFSRSRTVDSSVATGVLDVTDRQRSLLGIRSRAGSVAPEIGWPADAPPGGLPSYPLPPVAPPQGWWG